MCSRERPEEPEIDSSQADASNATLVGLIGVDFPNHELLDEAMSHRSWCAEHPGNPSNERLEFLGDAVLGFLAADLAYRRFPAMSEGELTGIRKGVVNATALAEVAVELGIGPFIKLGKGENAAGGAAKPSILADAIEAVIGAVFLEAGLTGAREFVERLLSDRVDATALRLDELDYKSTLQEVLAALGRPAPSYALTASGPDHDKKFVAHVVVDDVVIGAGGGRSKRIAEQAAAADATRTLRAQLTAG